ncbi:MAG: mandelate racemase/muconate lactonizing enzyme family protein [Chloroflexi bacterium]|nr:mandelate racemase/muconate lactonizing enzyme family protein [Chloroflexota bacterium]
MQVTRVETLRSKEPVILPEPWLPAWNQPNGTPVTQWYLTFYKVYTDEGIIGYGPHTGYVNPSRLIGMDPCHVEAFWDANMSGRRAGNSGQGAAGLEIALWDIIGKAAGLPLYKLLGAYTDRLMVYAATSRLLEPQETVEQVLSFMAQGYKAVKLRLHRPDPWADLDVVRMVREAAGDELVLLVDANQNNVSPGYRFWSRQTALRMARALDELGVYFMEEPLPRNDVEGLAEIAATVDMFIAGGEHTPTVYDWREYITRGAFDIVQPDAVMGGNYGITGLRRVAQLADYFGRLIVPHVLTGGHFVMDMAASLHAMATVENCPMVEFGIDPPVLTAETSQSILKQPFQLEPDGTVRVPDAPGLGIELQEDMLEVVG